MGQVSSQDSIPSFIHCGCDASSGRDHELTPFEPDVLGDSLRLDNVDGIDIGEWRATRSLSASAWAMARRRVFASHLKTSFANHHRILRQVGEGTYGHVYEAETHLPGLPGNSMPSRPRCVAVKCFKLVEANKGDATGMGEKAMRESFEKERAILARLEHPHIVKMYECFEERQSLWLVLELCRGGELYEYVAALANKRRSEGGAFDEPEARLYFRQMLHAVSFLHKVKIVHRDIKTENFLLLGDVGSTEGCIIKLCDFGTAVQLSPQMPRALGRIGTLSYTAPEIYARRGADLCADMWSLGVVLYVLLVGASPFRITGTESRNETSKRILTGSYDTARPGWMRCSDRAKDLVAKLLVVEEPSRLVVRDAMKHPWLSSTTTTIPAVVRSNQRLTLPVTLSPESDKEVVLSQLAAHLQPVLHLLLAFSRLDALQQLFMLVYAQVTPDSELLSHGLRLPWYDLFFALDEDCDGRLGLSEFHHGLQRLMKHAPTSGRQEVNLQELIESLDMGGNGFIGWVQWTAVALSAVPTLASEPEPLHTVFRMMDRPSCDGVISVVDLMVLLNDSPGRSAASTSLQEEAKTLVDKWSAHSQGLSLQDAKRLLQAAAQECWLPANTGSSPSNQSAKQPGWLGCCEQNPSEIRQETIITKPAIPRVRLQDIQPPSAIV